MKYWILAFIFIWSPRLDLQAQATRNPQGSEDNNLPSTTPELEQLYQKNITKSYLNGVYIPADLADAINQLNQLIDDKARQKFKSAPDTVCAKQLFFSLGRWMEVNWNLRDGSRLSVYLQKLGLRHPDDMVRFLIIMYHRSINKKELKAKELIDHYNKIREAERLKRLSKGTIIEQTTRPATHLPDSLKQKAQTLPPKPKTNTNKKP